jgi:NarL family two-component system response regulator LiaR
VQLAAQHVPDVTLMDLVMPGMDGVEATRQLKQVSPRTQVIVLTSYHDDEHIFPVLRAGALSYILKDVGVEVLADAIRKAAQGEAVLHPRVAARVIKDLQGGLHDQPNPFVELSDRELEVLRLIASGMSNTDIAAQLVRSERPSKATSATFWASSNSPIGRRPLCLPGARYRPPGMRADPSICTSMKFVFVPTVIVVAP